MVSMYLVVNNYQGSADPIFPIIPALMLGSTYVMYLSSNWWWWCLFQYEIKEM